MMHLDALRFVAAAGIVFLHDAEMLGHTWPALKFLVDLFFVVSGYVIADVYAARLGTAGDYGRFLWKRVARLVPLHWLTLALWLGFALVAARLGIKANHAQEFDLKCLAPNALMLNATGLCDHLSFNGPSWSIGAEAFMYVAAPLIFLLGWRALILAGASILLLSLLPGARWYTWMSHFGVLRALPSFCIGAALYRLRGWTVPIPAAAAAICLGLFAVAAFAGRLNLGILMLIYLGVAAAVGADQRGKTGRLITLVAPLAQLTYSSYMIHTLILTLSLTIVGDRLLHLHGAARLGMAALAFAAVWPIAYLSLNFFEHPAREWINRRGIPASPRIATA